MELQSLIPALYVVLFFIHQLSSEKSSLDTFSNEVPNNPRPWQKGDEIIYPSNPKFPYITYVKAPYKNALILQKAKLLVDKAHPLRCGPNGLSFISVRYREYYLNQCLWFYEENGRFPDGEILKGKAPFKGFAWDGSPDGYEPHQWILPPSYTPNYSTTLNLEGA